MTAGLIIIVGARGVKKINEDSKHCLLFQMMTTITMMRKTTMANMDRTSPYRMSQSRRR